MLKMPDKIDKIIEECAEGKLTLSVTREGVRVRDHKPETMVIFRVWDNGDVFAFLPCQMSWELKTSSYFWLEKNHVYKHWEKAYGVESHYPYFLKKTRPATAEEGAVFADELKELGYRPVVRQRAPTAWYRKVWVFMGNT
jgi:hypothetical protein